MFEQGMCFEEYCICYAIAVAQEKNSDGIASIKMSVFQQAIKKTDKPTTAYINRLIKLEMIEKLGRGKYITTDNWQSQYKSKHGETPNKTRRKSELEQGQNTEKLRIKHGETPNQIRRKSESNTEKLRVPIYKEVNKIVKEDSITEIVKEDDIFSRTSKSFENRKILNKHLEGLLNDLKLDEEYCIRKARFYQVKLNQVHLYLERFGDAMYGGQDWQNRSDLLNHIQNWMGHQISRDQKNLRQNEQPNSTPKPASGNEQQKQLIGRIPISQAQAWVAGASG